MTTIPPRPWSDTEFLRVLCDQSLLAASNSRFVYDGWKSDNEWGVAAKADAWWLFPYTLVLVDFKLSACRTNGFRALFARNDLEAAYAMHERLPMLGEHFAHRTTAAVTRALQESPHFREPITVTRRGLPFVFTDFNGCPCVELP
jgi:hypothetical protein